MKRICILIMAIAFLLSSTTSLAAEKNLGFTTESFYIDMNACLDALGTVGFQHYHIELSEKDRESLFVSTPLSMHCSMMIQQGDGMVESIKVVSDEQHGNSADNEHTSDVITCFLAAMLLTNSTFSEDNAMSYLNEIVSDHQEHTYGNVTYRFSSTAPFSTIVSLEITPAA